MSCPPFGSCSGDGSECWDGSSYTASCWFVVWIQIGFGIALVAYGDLNVFRKAPWVALFHTVEDKMLNKNTKDEEEDEQQQQQKQERKEQQQQMKRLYIPEAHEFEDICHGFVMTKRTQDNFVLDVTNPNVKWPNSSSYEYKLIDFGSDFFLTAVTLFVRSPLFLLSAKYVHSAMISSFGWGCLCSAASTVFWLIMSYDDYCVDNGYTDNTPNKDYIEQVGTIFRFIYGSFIFFPVFLFVGYISFVVGKWRDWFGTCHEIQTVIINIAMICGGKFKSPVSIKKRKKLFTMYRYLNLIHAMAYKRVSPTMRHLLYQDEFVTQLGLLTETEGTILRSVQDGHEIETVFSWFVTLGIDLNGGDRLSEINSLRDAINQHNCNYINDNPNLYVQMMFIMVTWMIVLIIAGNPFTYLIYTDGGSQQHSLILTSKPCFQPLVMMSVFILNGTLRIAFMLMFVLRDPFAFTGERIKVDHLLARTDRTIFAHIRANFFHSDKNNDDDDDEGEKKETDDGKNAMHEL